MTFAQARADVDAPAPRHLVQIKRMTPVQHAQMNRIVGLGRQLLQPGPGHARQMHLLTGGMAKLQQLGAERIAFARAERQQPPLDQG